MKSMMQLLAVCIAVIFIVTGFALTVVGSEWGMALVAGGSVALIALAYCASRKDMPAPRPEQPRPDAFDFFWNNAHALGERPWTHNLHAPAPRPRCEELN